MAERATAVAVTGITGDPILAAIQLYFEAKLAAHGMSAKGVDWNGEAGQRLRHSQFLRLVAPDPDASVLDFGCGYGDFLPFLRAHGHRGRYIGLDITPAMVRAARDLHGEGSDRVFHLAAIPPEPIDYAVASGVFNVIRGADSTTWARHVEVTIAKLARSARRGFGFNLLSLNSDPERRRADLHYADPPAMLAAMIARYGRHVALLQDYGLWEFTLLVRHPPNSAAGAL
jgi:SAM-dependent methyltransferase